MSCLIRGMLLLITISITLTSCEKPPDADQEQQFTVVAVYEGMSEYVKAARSNPEADLDQLFQKHVNDAYWNECGEGGEYSILGESTFKNPINDIDGLEKEISSLRSSEIEEIILKALEQASGLLDGPDTTVCIAALDPENANVRENMDGVSGKTLGSGKILMQVSLQKDWEDWVSYIIAHEYHHSVWTSHYLKTGEVNDLLNYLVFEGKADSFAALVYPEFVIPWRDALTPEQESEQWRKMKSQLTMTDIGMQQRYMFGDGRSIPYWSGYTIGFRIVQSYLQNNPGITIADWTTTDAWEILEQSGYSGEN